ncbi:MAG: right-handed parallel beta-helix repeat-containing protein [Vicingaceae bacterium]|nr:right-handed parallel beta-helix repeat-containing protein [Vicingaceae bacterium]
MKKILYLFSMLLIGGNASAQLSGTYSVYGTGAYAPSIQNACDSLMMHGQSGPVVFEIADSLMADEAVTLTAVAGNSMTNTITFTSASADSSKVSVVSTTGNTFNITGVDYISFTHLTLGYNGAFGNTVNAESTDISFANVKVDHTPANGGYAIDIDRDAGVNNFMFTNSDLMSTNGGIYLYSDLSDIKGVTFTNANLISVNKALEIYAQKSLIDFTSTSSYFYSNNSYAADLQGYYTKIENVNIDNSEFQGGAAFGSGDYALYMWSDFIIENVDIDNSTFYSPNSDAVYMGADYTRLNDVEITNTNIYGLDLGLELYSDVVTSNITLNNDSIISNPDDSVGYGDDAAYIEGTGLVEDVLVSNSFFVTSNTQASGIGLYIYSGSNQVNNVNINNNEFNSYEGIEVYAETSGSNWLVDANVVNSQHTGVDLEPEYGIGKNITVTNNTIITSPGNNGDGIYMGIDGRFEDVTIDRNTIKSDDDGVYMQADYGGLDNIIFTNNNDSTNNGEGVRFESGANVENVTVNGNTIYSGNNEGVYFESDDASLINLIVNDNTIDSDGDGIYFDSYVKQLNTEIDNNTINAGGEGIYFDNSDGDIENVTITNNIDTASSWGIDLDAYSSILNVTIENNMVYANNNEGVYLYAEYSVIDNTVFKNNAIYAPNDYGIYMEGDDNAVNNTTIIDSNYVVSGDEALYIEGEYGGIEGITIDNSYFESTGNYGAYIIADYVYLKDVSIKNSTFVGDTSTVNYNYASLYLESDDSYAENVEIVNNTLVCDYYGIYFEADYGNAKNTTIENNDITCSYYAINFDGIGDNSSVSYNTIKPFGLLGWGIYAYGFDGSAEGVNINGNTMTDLWYIGIDVQYVKDLTISNNYIRSIDTTTVNEYGVSAYYADGTTTIDGNQILFNDGYVGIYFGYSNAQAAIPSIISNNFVSGCDYSIDVEDADNVNVYHNSVSSNSNNTDNLIYFSDVNNVNFDNNIVKADSAAAGTIYYCTSCNNVNTANNVFDFDSTSVDMASDAYFGNNTSLFDMQSNTSFDAASFMADPMFANDTTDLHISCSNNALVAAPFMAAVPNDVDGGIRNTTTTTIGAHEITPTGADILPATMTICNVGIIVPNATGASYLWTPGNATTPTLSVTAAGTYYLQLTDYCGNVYNDSIVVTEDLPVASFTTTSGGSIFIFTNTSTNATSYMWDFGDGNTSTDVNPTHVYAGLDSTYTVTLIATNACGSDTLTMVITTVDIVENLETRGLNIYPNPVNENLTLDFGLLVGEDIVINIFDIQGRTLITDQIIGESGPFQKVISVNSLTDGIYFVRIATNDEVITKKVIKN